MTRGVSQQDVGALLFLDWRSGDGDTVLNQFLAERVAVQAKNARGMNLVSAGAPEGHFDQGPLQLTDELLVKVVGLAAVVLEHLVDSLADKIS